MTPLRYLSEKKFNFKNKYSSIMYSVNNDFYNCYPGILLLVNNEMGIFIEQIRYLMCDLLKREKLQVT